MCPSGWFPWSLMRQPDIKAPILMILMIVPSIYKKHGSQTRIVYQVLSTVTGSQLMLVTKIIIVNIIIMNLD